MYFDPRRLVSKNHHVWVKILGLPLKLWPLKILNDIGDKLEKNFSDG
jgi:hypothetical protein